MYLHVNCTHFKLFYRALWLSLVLCAVTQNALFKAFWKYWYLLPCNLLVCNLNTFLKVLSEANI